LSVLAPPQYVVNGVEQAVPGFWDAWMRAVTWAHFGSAPWRATSWWRTPAMNLAAGSVHRFSQHLLGTAFDLAPNRAALRELRAVGFIVIDEGSHLHAQPWPAGSGENLIRSLRLV